MIELLTDNPEDKGYDLDKKETSESLEIYVEQIKMFFETSEGQIMNFEATMDLEDLIFEKNLDEALLTQKIRGGLANFCSLYEDFGTEINLFFAEGEERDICLISITIDGVSNLSYLIK